MSGSSKQWSPERAKQSEQLFILKNRSLSCFIEEDRKVKNDETTDVNAVKSGVCVKLGRITS